MIKCANCGQENNPGSTFCAFCGFNVQPSAAPSQPQQSQTPPQPPQPQQTPPMYQPTQPRTNPPTFGAPPPARGLPESSLAPVILGLGIAGFVLCQILGPVAWIMGHMERQKVARGEIAPSGLITAGWILGIVATALLGLFVFFMVIGAFAGGL